MSAVCSLNEQKAAYGLATEPHVLVEIEDIETEIEELQAEVAASGELSHLTPIEAQTH